MVQKNINWKQVHQRDTVNIYLDTQINSTYPPTPILILLYYILSFSFPYHPILVSLPLSLQQIVQKILMQAHSKVHRR